MSLPPSATPCSTRSGDNMEEYIVKDGKKLRLGYTTGSCAAAAAKAAAYMLLTGRDAPTVDLLTPKGIALTLPVLQTARGADFVSCAIRKDSGDYNEEVCLVLKGKLRLVANREANSRSAPLEIAYLTPGSFLGENCLSHSVFRLSGTAAEFTELLCISRGRLKALLEEHPAIGVKLLQCFLASLSEKIMRSNELRREAAAYDHNAVNEK